MDEDGALRACLEGSASLPPRAFTDPQFAQQEQRSIWPTAWTPIIAAEPLPGPGERVPATWQDSPVFMQGGPDELRVFPNVCTHAWHTLVQSRTTRSTLVCPQHARSFGTDGTCLGQPAMDAPNFPGPEDHLQPMSSQSIGPLVFASRGDADGKPPVLDALAESVSGLDLASLQPMPERFGTRTLAGNWKHHASNYLDQLHIRHVHADSLGSSLDVASYETEMHDGGVLQWARSKDATKAFANPPHPRFGDGVFALWWFVWPNTTVNIYPWGISVNVYRPGPTPDQTLFDWMCWSWNQADPEEWSLTAADDEDVAAIAEVAKGVQSPFAKPGRFAVSERAVQSFHQQVARSVLDQF